MNGRRATFDSIMPATLMNSERSVDCGAPSPSVIGAVGRLIARVAPAALMIWRTSFGMWADRLSITTMSPGCSDGARHCGFAWLCLPPHRVVHFADRCGG